MEYRQQEKIEIKRIEGNTYVGPVNACPNKLRYLFSLANKTYSPCPTAEFCDKTRYTDPKQVESCAYGPYHRPVIEPPKEPSRLASIINRANKIIQEAEILKKANKIASKTVHFLQKARAIVLF